MAVILGAAAPSWAPDSQPLNLPGGLGEGHLGPRKPTEARPPSQGLSSKAKLDFRGWQEMET